MGDTDGEGDVERLREERENKKRERGLNTRNAFPSAESLRLNPSAI